MFIHNPIDIPEVSTKNIDRKRFYDTPTGFYPSITTVLGVRKEKKEGLRKWRERVGNDVANHIMRSAAGRVDCIAEWNGVPSIIDFKTSRSERKDDYNFEYYMQASAYAEMFEERTGIEINQIVILVVTEDGLVQEFVKEKHEYLPHLVETIDMFTEQWEKDNEESNVINTTSVTA